jgi:hypothetical protein
MKGGPPMDKEEKLQALLRLKRHEQPPEGFAEEFLEKFQRRQRTELVRRSALSILWERSQAWLDGLRRPAVIWSAAGIYAAVLITLWLVPRPAPSSGNTTLVVATTGRPNPPAVRSTTVDYSPGKTGASIPAKPDVPGSKRRTSDQPQEKQNLIGPETKPEEPQPPLREL